MKYKEWLDVWFANYIKPSSKKKTCERYSEIIEKHLKVKLGEYELEELSPIVIQKYITELITKIGELQDMTERNEKIAFSLAESTLRATDIDILSSNVGLWYLCRAELIARKSTIKEITEFFAVSLNDKETAARRAKTFYDKHVGKENK